MNTVEEGFVWSHENASQVAWTDNDDFDGMTQQDAWLSGQVQLSVWKEPTGFYAWCFTLWTGSYPFVNDQEVRAITGYIEIADAKWDAIRNACRWLSLQEAEDGLMELIYAEQEKAEAQHNAILDQDCEDDRRFDAMEFAGREEPHADLQRWD